MGIYIHILFLITFLHQRCTTVDYLKRQYFPSHFGQLGQNTLFSPLFSCLLLSRWPSGRCTHNASLNVHIYCALLWTIHIHLCACNKLLCSFKTQSLCAFCGIAAHLWLGPVVQTPVSSAARYSCSRRKAGCLEGCSPPRRYTDRGWEKGCWRAPRGHGWCCRHTTPGRRLLRCHHPGRQTALHKARRTP